MSFTSTLLMIAQSASPMVAEAPLPQPVAVRATASARILRPAVVSFEAELEAHKARPLQSMAVQRDRDASGTVWIEFS